MWLLLRSRLCSQIVDLIRLMLQPLLTEIEQVSWQSDAIAQLLVKSLC